MVTQDLLKNLGLLEVETKIYLAALELGKCLPKHLADKAGVKRPTLYESLPGLLGQGLLSETVIGKRRYFVAEDPQILMEKKQSELEQLEKLIPELRILLTTSTTKPKIIFYEGVEGVKKIYLDNLRERKATLNFIGLENINPEINEYAQHYYIPRRIRYGINIDILISGSIKSSFMYLKTDPYALRKIKTIDAKKFPIPLDCYIYGDNVSFSLWRKDSEPIGLIIRSKEIAITMRSLFNFIWEKA
ncbi:MAG: TrmB family transcriptional regulator [Candidatus Paceibacterales bacterium]